MADPRRSDSTKLGASLVGRVAGGPAPGLVAEGEVWVLRLAVPRHLNDLAAGTFLVDVLLCGPPARTWWAGWSRAARCASRAPLDVGSCQTVDGGRRWGLQLVARELAIEEIDLADACPLLESHLVEGAARRL
jgi:hypothetical protein